MTVVWASNAMINPAMLRAITHSFGDDDQIDFAITARRRNDAGESLPSEFFPREIYVAKHANTNYDKLPHFFFAGSYWVVSGEVAAVMRQFDLGGGHLYPTSVFRKDRKTPIGNTWFCLNFGNVKTAFLPDQSIKKRPLGPSKTYWLPDDLEHNSVAVSRAALTGVDIWVDAIFGNTFFVSDRLAEALKVAGVAGPFGFKKCRVI